MTTRTARKGERRVRSERLEARISPAQKKLFKKAAALEGRSLTDFIVSSVSEAARRTVHDFEVMDLSGRDREAFVKSLSNPGSPNKALRSAAAWYKTKLGK